MRKPALANSFGQRAARGLFLLASLLRFLSASVD
jgi:hypothetical protein